MGEKFAGVGLKNILIIWVCCVLLSLMAKVIATKYQINGLSQVILAGA